MSATLAVAIFVGAYALSASEKANRVAVALTGAGLMLALGVVSSADAFHSEEFGIAWDVIFLLLGMMIIVGVIKQTGLFDYLAIWSAKRARGQPFRILATLVTITAVASALLDNVTTVLLIAPVTFLICERLDIPAAPFLIAQALASNIGGTATLIGDPPNIIIASQADLSYTDFLLNLAPVVVVLMLLFVVMSRWLFRNALVYRPERVRELMSLDEREALGDRPLLVRSLIVLALVTAAFALHGVLHYEPSVVALLGAGLLLLLARRDPEPFLREIEWPTLAFFMGLYIMVGALIKPGVIVQLAEAVAAATGGSLWVASMLLLWVSGLLSAIVDNIPYVATMAPVTATLVQELQGEGETTVLWWSLALGADLGGNATAIGASANVVILGLAQRSGQPISFWEFTKYGAVVAVATMLVCMPYLWLRYFIFA
ncbi:MAG TPA: ArsB/NhaD family transporter [Actinomycetes bacterium]|nr:ArsB/NhaD family transporter [Actinomycetes bacterium]